MDIHFNGYKIRYEILDHYFKPVITSTNIKSMNIFINLDDFIHMLHRPIIDNEFQVAGVNASKQFVSNVLNLLGHYRNWAIKYYHVDVKVFGVYTSFIRSFKNSIYIPEYRKKFRENNDSTNGVYFFINQTIKESIKIFTTIGQFIPDIYLIDSKYLEPSCIPYYISNAVSPADWNILITRDTYDLQYAYKNKWLVFRPKGDNSSVLHKGNIWNYLNEKERIYTKEIVDIQYHPSLYIYAKAVVGDTYRSIPRLRKIGWKTIFKYLGALTEEFDENTSPILLRIALMDDLKAKKISDEEYERNLKCVDVELQASAIMEVDKTAIESQIIDRYDFDDLNRLNKEIFMRYPLRLEFLCRENIQKPKSIWDKK